MRNFLITKKTYNCGKRPALKSSEWFGAIISRHTIKRLQKSYSAVSMWMLWKFLKNATSKYYKGVEK